MNEITKGISLLLRFVIAAVFLYAGISKIGDPAAFAHSIDLYRAVPHMLSVITALYLPWVEIACAGALFFPKLRVGALAILSACSVVFVVMISMALARGLDIACGCFGAEGGGSGRSALLLSLARAGALAVVCGWLFCRELKHLRAVKS